MTGAEQAKMLVMAIGSIIIVLIILSKRKHKEELNEIQKLNEEEVFKPNNYNPKKKKKNRTTHNLRTDGYYSFHGDVFSIQLKKHVFFHFVLIVNSHGIGIMLEEDDEISIKKSDFVDFLTIKKTDAFGKSEYTFKNGKFNMIVYRTEANSEGYAKLNKELYWHWQGKMQGSKLILNASQRSYNWELQDYVINPVVEGVEFDFKRVI